MLIWIQYMAENHSPRDFLVFNIDYLFIKALIIQLFKYIYIYIIISSYISWTIKHISIKIIN